MLTFDFAAGLMRRLALNEDAIAFFTQMADDVLSRFGAETEAICDLLSEKPFEYAAISELCDQLAQKSGYHEYAVTVFVFLAASERLHESYQKRGINDEIFYNTVDDVRCKLNECMAVYGMHGCFVREWLLSFYKMQRFGLGRLCFELGVWQDEPILFGGHMLWPGDRYICVHIPANGRPFDAPARQAAYELAAAFFRHDFSTPYVPIICTSWLLDPTHRLCLPESSNIRRFADDFDVLIGRRLEKFTNGWRIFASRAEGPAAELPEDSTLQRVYKKRLMDNDDFYNGCGILWMKAADV